MKKPFHIASIIFLFSVLKISFVFSQEKNLQAEQVSSTLQNWLAKNYPSHTKIKFHQESHHDSLFVEANFKANNEAYELTFYNDSLIEMEIVLNFEQIDPVIQTKIYNHIQTHFPKYKIILCEKVNPQSEFKYEIKIQSHVKNSSGFFALYFNEKGDFINQEEEVNNPIPTQN